ncbi:MAG TPA: M3 family oligoendopeptidase, partial [Candidatus Saccharimonadales bacterium]|nr:M3 family oligoendopeptidase [Candidatus Saccharimonadales bacterium]
KVPALKEALDDLEAWERQAGLGNEGFYFHLRLVRDSANPELQAKASLASEFLQGIVNQLQFFWINISNIDPKLHQQFLNAPELADYRHYLEGKFAEAAHRLSEPEEKIMTLKQTVAHDKWEEMTERFLSQGERQVKDEAGKTVTGTLETLLSLVSSRNKAVRDGAVIQLNDLLNDYLDMAEAEMNALLANKKIDDELRHYPRPDAARHLADDIDTAVVDALVAAVSGRFDISQRYYQLKAKLLGQPTLAYHERNVPYGTVEKPYPYPEAVALVHDVYHHVSPEFADIFKRFVEAGQVDVFPHKGKRGGAFCTIQGLSDPVYVMLNHTNKLQDVTTIAHEFGHAINHELTKQQNALNYGISLATAEVASTFMEGFVIERLLAEADDELRLALMLDQVNGHVSSIMRQIAMYRFEQELHAQFREKGFLPREQIGALFAKHMAAYMGPAVTHEAGSENWWLYVGHFRVMFYVYSYASGELISKALQARVKQEPAFIKQVRDRFLAVGSARSVKDTFASMDIDITDKGFWENGLAEIDQLLTETEALAKKLGKID